MPGFELVLDFESDEYYLAVADGSQWGSAIAYENWFDDATLTVSSALALAPATKMQNEHVQDCWSATGETEYIIIDLLEAKDVDVVSFRNLVGADHTMTTRCRLSIVSDGVTDATYDSGSSSGRVNATYRSLTFFPTLTAPSRYCRVDFTQTGITRVKVGRGIVAPMYSFETNFQAGWARTAKRLSEDQFGYSGGTFVDRRAGHWQVEVEYRFLTQEERHGFIEAIDALNVTDGHVDVLWVKNVYSENLGRDTIWGYVEGDSPVSEPVALRAADQLFTKSFTIRERR